VGDRPGYTQAGTITTFCHSGNFASGDSGYAYMGGWSGTWNTLTGSNAIGSAIDAGLQYNYELSTESADDYSMFMKIGGLPKDKTIISTGNWINPKTGKPAYAQPTHIVCSRFKDTAFANLSFSVVPTTKPPTQEKACWKGSGVDILNYGPLLADCQTYMLILTAESYNFKGETDGKLHTKVIGYVSPDLTQGGWATLMSWKSLWYDKPATLWTAETYCKDCIFKWMTSIAQSKENLTDKSYYGATWSNRQISGFATHEKWPQGGETVPLTAAITDCSEYPLWHTPYPTKYNTDCTTTPAGLKGTTQSVKVWKYSPEEEFDTIDLKY
jgi:hypothetical protein